METCEKFIRKNKMFCRGDVVGVGCSGGSDSMALLNYLVSMKNTFDIEVVAIHIDHGIRENSQSDCEFVRQQANKLGIRFYNFKVDVNKIAREEAVSLETAGRNARYAIFRSLVSKGIVDKVALAHHQQDQAETILMHIFRGCGLAGAKGMDPISEGIFVRPFLDVKKSEIMNFIAQNDIPFVNDYTNDEIEYNRNYVRNVLFKDITARWPNAVESIVNFGKSVRNDDEFINSQIYEDAIICEDKLVKIPLSYFLFSPSVISRLIFRAMKNIGIYKDIERRHIMLLTKLALEGENGDKLFLPFDSVAVKEYDYITIFNRKKAENTFVELFGVGETVVPGYGTLVVKKVKGKKISGEELVLDCDKLPKDVVWRFRKEGDVFAKFGSGKKKLKSYFIDKKIPARIRGEIPVLASGNEVYVVGNIEISQLVKVDENTTSTFHIKLKNKK